MVEGAGDALIAADVSPYFWCTAPLAVDYFVPAIDVWKQQGAQTIVLMTTANDAFSTTSMSGVRNRSQTLGYNILLDVNVATDCASSSVLQALMQQAALLNPDALVVAGYAADLTVFINTMSVSGLVPKAAGSTLQIASIPALLLTANWWFSSILWMKDSGFGVANTAVFGTSADFYQNGVSFLSANMPNRGFDVEWPEAMGAFATLSLQLAIENAAAGVVIGVDSSSKLLLHPEALRASFIALDTPTFWGTARWSAQGQLTGKRCGLQQFINYGSTCRGFGSKCGCISRSLVVAS